MIEVKIDIQEVDTPINVHVENAEIQKYLGSPSSYLEVIDVFGFGHIGGSVCGRGIGCKGIIHELPLPIGYTGFYPTEL